MKAPRMTVWTRWAVVAIVLPAASCNRSVPAAWIFEPQPKGGVAVGSAQDIAVDSSGTPGMLLVYNEDGKSRVGYTMSHDGGDNFMHPIPVSDPDAYVSVQGETTPTLAKVPTAIYALWEQPGPKGENDLMLARSLTYGHSFDRPVRVNDEEKSFHGYSSVAASPDGDVYAVWLDARETTPSAETFAIYFARSRDQGASFEKNQRVALAACPCCRPRIAVGARGELYVAWRKVFAGDIRDMVVSTSYDGGNTFAPEVRVADDGWHLRGCPHSGPSMVESNGRLYVAWLTEGREQHPRVQLAWSDDEGRHFHTPLIVSGETLDPNHPVLSASEDGRVLVAFQGRTKKADGSWEPTAAFMVEVAGDKVSSPVPLPNDGGSVSNPRVAAGTGGRVYVAWSQRTDENSKPVLLRGRRQP
jgi:hypothetical protein